MVSQENVEQVREAVDAFNRRDLDAYLALMEPDVELTRYERVVEGLSPYRGHGGVRAWWRETDRALSTTWLSGARPMVATRSRRNLPTLSTSSSALPCEPQVAGEGSSPPS